MGTLIEERLAGIVSAELRSEVWSESIQQARHARVTRSAGPKPVDRVRALRETLDGELVSFHRRLHVAPYNGELVAEPGTRLWDIHIPLTLFPRRDCGFHRVECIVEFTTDTDSAAGLRVVALRPAERERVMARAELAGELALDANARLGLPVPLVTGMAVARASAALYGKAEVLKQHYKAERQCVVTEIVRGTGARWRLDDPHDRSLLAAESHELGVVVQLAEGAGPLHAEGYMQAYSDERWLTMTVGSFWKALTGRIKAFFARGMPAEAYAEWRDILSEG